MPTRDALHDLLRRLLEAAGWLVTNDPLVLPMDERNAFVDLGAEQDGRQIAVEIKGFGSRSLVADLEQALGQYILYRTLLRDLEPEREVFLALPQNKFDIKLKGLETRGVLRSNDVKLIVFNEETEEIVQWIEWN